MKEYLFTFTEVIRGSVKIESKVMPTEDEVIQAIMDGSAYYSNTEFEDIHLAESEKKPAQMLTVHKEAKPKASKIKKPANE